MPPGALTLRLARPTIKMRHEPGWRIDKVNPVHDLVVCLSGRGAYVLGEDETEEPHSLSEGEAMLVPAYTRFRGQHAGEGLYTGLAQHFTLELFGRDDVVRQMDLARVVRLPDWDRLGPLAHLLRETAPHGSTTLAQHHQVMVLLLAYLEAAFRGWRDTAAKAPQSQDRLSLHIMFVAARLASDPMGAGSEPEAVLASVPYNADYFRRAFRDRIGMTPQKYRERKRMEFAANRLGQGLPVKAVAAELGYSDPYFFSRMFKRHLGSSPSAFREYAVPLAQETPDAAGASGDVSGPMSLAPEG